jgi:hypothetical protein
MRGGRGASLERGGRHRAGSGSHTVPGALRGTVREFLERRGGAGVGSLGGDPRGQLSGRTDVAALVQEAVEGATDGARGRVQADAHAYGKWTSEAVRTPAAVAPARPAGSMQSTIAALERVSATKSRTS